jgi:hypothetical protein
VAKAKPVMRAAEPLQANIWRHVVKQVAKWLLLSICGVVWIGLVLFGVYVYAN